MSILALSVETTEDIHRLLEPVKAELRGKLFESISNIFRDALESKEKFDARCAVFSNEMDPKKARFTQCYLKCLQREWDLREALQTLPDHSIIFQSHPESAEVKIICFGENHEDDSPEINGRTLEGIAQFNKVIFLEESFSVEEGEEYRAQSLIRLGLDPNHPNHSQIKVIGWDISANDPLWKEYRELSKQSEELKKIELNLKTQISALVLNHMNEKVEDIEPIIQKLSAVKQQRLELETKRNELRQTNFPRRTASMINALREAKKMQNENPGTVIIINAGARHLAHRKGLDDPIRSSCVNEFYGELQSDPEHPAIVCIPKDLAKIYIQASYTGQDALGEASLN